METTLPEDLWKGLRSILKSKFSLVAGDCKISKDLTICHSFSIIIQGHFGEKSEFKMEIVDHNIDKDEDKDEDIEDVLCYIEKFFNKLKSKKEGSFDNDPFYINLHNDSIIMIYSGSKHIFPYDVYVTDFLKIFDEIYIKVKQYRGLLSKYSLYRKSQNISQC